MIPPTPHPKRNPTTFHGTHNPRGPAWKPAEDAHLGTGPDSRVAALLGRTRAAVIARRRALGIPPATGPGRPPGTPKTPTPKKPRGRPRKTPIA
jgi:hypothetical protein